MQLKLAANPVSSAEVTAPDPAAAAEGHLARAAATLDPGQRLDCLSRALPLDPAQLADARQMGETLRESLAVDPFLAYVSEDDRLYVVRTSDDRYLAVPKRRLIPPSDPARGTSALRLSRHWLALAAIGVIPAGLVALVCAPVAGVFAIRSIREARDEHERRRAVVAGACAVFLFAVALLLLVLLLLHV